MQGATLLDTGPLVALLCRQERWHRWTVERFARLRAPLLTCEAVLAEADYLIRRANRAALVMELVQRGVLALGLSIADEVASIVTIQTKYRDRPASLADACLVRMAEIHDGSSVMTFDGDFRFYRRHGRRAIPLLTP